MAEHACQVPSHSREEDPMPTGMDNICGALQGGKRCKRKINSAGKKHLDVDIYYDTQCHLGCI